MNQSTQSRLDSPIWAALTTRQAHLGEGDLLARRYHPDVAPFAAVASQTQAPYEALHQLLLPHDHVAVLSVDPVAPIDALRAEPVGVIHQMVAAPLQGRDAGDDDVISLSHADAQDMYELVQKTKPGPFGKRTHEMGHYIGIRDQGRLVAMAGERMHLDGYVEISAVCVDDDWRGRGIAGRLMNILRRDIEQRGETPFLHVLGNNHSAIRLYERLGFELRHTFLLTRISRADHGAA